MLNVFIVGAKKVKSIPVAKDCGSYSVNSSALNYAFVSLQEAESILTSGIGTRNSVKKNFLREEIQKNIRSQAPYRWANGSGMTGLKPARDSNPESPDV